MDTGDPDRTGWPTGRIFTTPITPKSHKLPSLVGSPRPVHAAIFSRKVAPWVGGSLLMSDTFVGLAATGGGTGLDGVDGYPHSWAGAFSPRPLEQTQTGPQ